MSKPAQPPPRQVTYEQRFPESQGPGVETGDGGVAYGVDIKPRVFITPRRDPADVAREREEEAARQAERCDRCRAVPDEVIEAVTTALQAAAKKKAGAP
jgi:hypothetical protein